MSGLLDGLVHKIQRNEELSYNIKVCLFSMIASPYGTVITHPCTCLLLSTGWVIECHTLEQHVSPTLGGCSPRPQPALR